MPGIRLRRIRWFALGAALAFLLGASAALAGTLDQAQQDTSNCARAVDDFQDTAQSFTAGRSGDLDQVDFNLGPLAAGAPAVAVQIRTVTTTARGDVPSGTVLATETVAPATGWNTVPFDPTVPVTAGTKYAIVLDANESVAFWLGSTTDAYAGGNPSADFLGIGWLAAAECDQAFRTYVAAPAVRPTSKQQCKKGGWRRFKNPSFKNQGQCVVYVNRHNGKGKDDQMSNGKKKGHGKRN
jgi:hypothetical protein